MNLMHIQWKAPIYFVTNQQHPVYSGLLQGQLTAFQEAYRLTSRMRQDGILVLIMLYLLHLYNG